jgi:hypothetical protein
VEDREATAEGEEPLRKMKESGDRPQQAAVSSDASNCAVVTRCSLAVRCKGILTRADFLRRRCRWYYRDIVSVLQALLG